MAKRSTIANRWFLKCFSVMIAVLALIDIILFALFRTYFYDSVEQTLKSELNVLSAVLTRYYTASSEIQSTVENFDQKNRMELMMLNSYGEVVITSSGFEPEDSYAMPDYDIALESESMTGVFTGSLETGERVMAVTALLDIPDENYSAVRLVASLTLVDKQIELIMLYVVAISLAVIVLMLILGLYFIRSIVIPLRAISANAKRIAQGDFCVHIEQSTNDELGELCGVFNYMARELENSENIKNDFISSVSHELRTPLTAIRGWSETVAHSLDDQETAAKGMKVISEETARLSDMVEELLDFSRMQGGRFNLVRQNMDVFAELTDAVIIYSERARKENKTLSYTEPAEIVMINGDRNRIRQVFINVIDNAVKYCGDGGHIAIETAISDGNVMIAVQDDGCGISKEDLPKVKSKFYKANNTVRGSGIGLAVADEIISAHAGSIEIFSEHGEYTRVEITLPRTSKENN